LATASGLELHVCTVPTQTGKAFAAKREALAGGRLHAGEERLNALRPDYRCEPLEFERRMRGRQVMQLRRRRDPHVVFGGVAEVITPQARGSARQHEGAEQDAFVVSRDDEVREIVGHERQVASG